MNAGSALAAPPKFYAYVVIDTAASPPAPVKLELSRQAAREWALRQPNAAELRVRRAKVFPFES